VRGESVARLRNLGLSTGVPILILLFFANSLTAAPQLAWEQRYNFGLPARTNQVIAMTLDNAGDIIIAGSQANANGDLDYAILKYSRSGTQHWAKTYNSGPQANDQLRAMTVDSNGNVYVTGTSTTVKYSSQGLLQWVAPYGGRALAADSNEFVYVVGFQTNDFATVKLAPNGTNVWLRIHDRPFGGDIAQAVALGPAGEVYVGGTVTWAYDRGGSYLKFALVKYDAAGVQLWVSPDFAPPDSLHVSNQFYQSEVRRIVVVDSSRVYLAGNFVGGSAGSYVTGFFDSEAGTNIWYYSGLGEGDGMTSMVVPSSGEVYMTGRLRGPGPRIIYRTIVLHTNGTLRWESDFDTHTSSYNRANGIALDALGNVFVTGQSANSYSFPPPSFDFLTIKYDNNGHELWTKRYNGPANGSDIAIGIAVTPDGSIFVAGQSANTNGGTDITLLKYVDFENIQWLPNGAVLLQFPATSGQSVRFQASTNLTTWQDIATVTVPPDCIARYTDTTVSQHPHRFYRLAVP
jgi:hypothetical protein